MATPTEQEIIARVTALESGIGALNTSMQPVLTQLADFGNAVRALREEFDDYRDWPHADISDWATDVVNTKLGALQSGHEELKKELAELRNGLGGNSGKGDGGVYRKQKDPSFLKMEGKDLSAQAAMFKGWSFEFEGHFGRLYPGVGIRVLEWAAETQTELKPEDIRLKLGTLRTDPLLDGVLYDEL